MEYIEQLTKTRRPPLDDPRAMFDFILAALPERVKVYPTENYFYFYFMHGGQKYSGNIRLDPIDRDMGAVNLVYFAESNEWRDDYAKPTYARFDNADSVIVQKRAPLLYQITSSGKSVDFELNDTTALRPPLGSLTRDEVYIGTIFDESAIGFLLVFNKVRKVFHYVLNETIPINDQLMATEVSPALSIGRRTGFAFYRDRHGRNMLVGAYFGNVRANNYFDGPFDQIPENFVEGDVFMNAVVANNPSLKGQIDRHGNHTGREEKSRVAILPYLLYADVSGLAIVHKCATLKNIGARYPDCFDKTKLTPILGGASGRRR